MRINDDTLATEYVVLEEVGVDKDVVYDYYSDYDDYEEIMLEEKMEEEIEEMTFLEKLFEDTKQLVFGIKGV